MLFSNENNFFIKEIYGNFKRKLNSEHFDNFSKLQNNFDRFEYLLNLTLAKEYKIEISDSNKNAEEAKLYKEKGNKAFQEENYQKSVELYTKSLLKSPVCKENVDLPIIRANRSAAWYHLNKYKEALLDIEEALALSYPKDLAYKVKDRKAKCLLALKQHKSGLRALQDTLIALDDAKISPERRLKWQKDIQIMVALMAKNNVGDEKRSLSESNDHNVIRERNPVYIAASDAVDIIHEEGLGRYAVAKRNIAIGEVFLTEEAHCSVLLESQSNTHCFHCMKWTEGGEPCNWCDRVKFCSSKCQKAALENHHSIECKILESLWKSGISVTCLMALRIISQRRPKYFMKLKDKLKNENEGIWHGKQYSWNDYLTTFSLVTHENERMPEALLEKTFVAVFLYRCLEEASYFEGIRNEEQYSCSVLIGGLILKNLQFLQFNAHSIFELECPKLDLNYSKSKFIGAGLYPTLALFNHSCNPGLVRYFEGVKVIARAIKPIKKGEMIGENYGPIFTEMRKDLRQKELKERYWFDCNCTPCREDWPLLTNMDTQVLRFRCENTLCADVIDVPVSTMNFMIQCTSCGKHTNIIKGLKTLQDTESLFKLGQEFLKNGNAKMAGAKYTELLQLLDETLVPPFRDYHLCQQGLRTSYVANGNKAFKSS